ncbi:MAG: DUF3788 domain-containing protein [Clostridium sp.]|nr:DUF3788 domain-containing protein [Clostridium sp.]
MYERMLNKQEQPTFLQMSAYCGVNAELFTKLNTWLSEICKTEQSITFPYGNQYGWGVAHRKKKKLICNVFAEAGAFTVMMRISNQQYASLYEQLKPYAREYIDNKYPCGNGGWIHYRVSDEQHMEDIQRLLYLRCF